MGTLSYTVAKTAAGRGRGAPTILSSTTRASGNLTTSGTAANIQFAAADLVLGAGEVIQLYADEAMRVAFGGTTATTSTGFYIPAAAQIEIECTDPGAVSAIDVA